MKYQLYLYTMDNSDDELEGKLATGFDRGVSYHEMKTKFIDNYNKLIQLIEELDPDDKWYTSKKRKLFNKLIYLIITIIQLANGSRISEACNAFKQFLEKGTENKVSVKIAKSKSVKYKKNGEKFITKTRYRNMQFPIKWIPLNNIDDLKDYFSKMKNLTRCVLNYMLRNYQCNTHSLRYAFINYMLYDQKQQMSIVAKFVGHSNMNQLTRYTQNKEVDKLFDLDDN